ncbi:DinB family protein [Flagellimonas pacifica]|uniref:DinB superfamily protein n=1 Tax=Flagellimonas pacifica TaxID=1247520 RepID=A0A285MQM0_9FLAO|nr:DinB family protein [Allomuricauda parva]SNY99438.1 DinB superfamily protein [Allomuricauda parva]
MRKILIPFMLLIFIQCSSDTKLSKKERDFAIGELNKSKDNLLSTIDSLSIEQLNFKINETSWSVAECTEHVTIFVDKVFEILEESLELPSNPERRKDVKFSDKELIAFVQDRANKTKTEEDFEPNNTFGSHTKTVNTYKVKLEKHIDYLKKTKDDLRNHYVNFGTIDTYQLFLYMAAHTNRHIEQIKEIKNDINFPKN